jgi:hypothetical protein
VSEPEVEDAPEDATDDPAAPSAQGKLGDVLRALSRARDVPLAAAAPRTSLSADDRLADRYQILAPLGAGGQGEVYRARDPVLAREVAIKVLRAGGALTQEQAQRLEREARAAAALSHPNVVAVHDFGQHQGAPYIVTELVAGSTLRERLAEGPLGARKAAALGAQIAEGLAAAHAKGLVHRDLKPENLLVTAEGRVKILDFGLAKLAAEAPRPAGPGGAAPDLGTVTADARIAGTVGYMSPEQVRGQPLDARSDLFSLGAILYELACGRRAFAGPSSAETMSAVLRDDPPPLPAGELSAALDRVVRRCLEKSAEQRFQSARDLAFQLAALAGASVTSEDPPPGARRPWRMALALAAALLLATALGALAWRAGNAPTGRAAAAPATPSAQPLFTRLTFRRGVVSSARYAPDGGVLYGAAWDGEPHRLFSTRAGRLDARVHEPPGARVLAVSHRDELLLSLETRSASTNGLYTLGRLARGPLAGGAPRVLLDEVYEADWTPEGDVAAAHRAGGRVRLDLPPGRTLYETTGWVGDLKTSPGGDLLAFCDHPVSEDDGGAVAVVDRAGKKRTLSAGWASLMGLAWSPAGDEVWFTAARAGTRRALRAVTLDGRERELYSAPGTLTLHDVSRGGRALVAMETWRSRMFLRSPGEEERELSWLDGSTPIALDAAARALLFTETWDGGGDQYASYLRPLQRGGGDAVRLGPGLARALSQDGALAVLMTVAPPRQVLLVPTGAGERRQVTRDGSDYIAAALLPGGRALALVGVLPGGTGRLSLLDLAAPPGSAPRLLTEEPVTGWNLAPSPDGAQLAVARASDERLVLVPTAGGPAALISGAAAGEAPLAWSAPGVLLVYRSLGLPVAVDRLEVATGRRERWGAISPSDRAGITGLTSVLVGADGKSTAFSYVQRLGDLYEVEGLR